MEQNIEFVNILKPELKGRGSWGPPADFAVKLAGSAPTGLLQQSARGFTANCTDAFSIICAKIPNYCKNEWNRPLRLSDDPCEC